MDVFILILNRYIDLIKLNNFFIVDREKKDAEFYIFDKNINSNFSDLITEYQCQESELNRLESNSSSWFSSEKRKFEMSQIFHIQTIVNESDFNLFSTNDIEYEMLSSNFLIKKEIILNYILYRGNLYFLNNLHQKGFFIFSNYFPIINVKWNEILSNRNFSRYLLPEEKMHYFDILVSDPHEFSKDPNFFLENIKNFFHIFYAISPSDTIGVKSSFAKTKNNFLQVPQDNKSNKNIFFKNDFVSNKNLVSNKKNLLNKDLVSTHQKTHSDKPKIESVSQELILPDDKNSGLFPRVILMTVGWNESLMIDMFLNYYAHQVDKIIYFDNDSNDDSIQKMEIFLNEKGYSETFLEIKKFDTGNEIRDDLLLEIKNNEWKKYKNEYDWLIFVDVDEFIVPPKKNKNISLKEFFLLNSDCGALQSIGYQMVGVKLDFNEISKGTKYDKYDKTCCWNLRYLLETNYSPGCHKCCPIFELDKKVLSKSCQLRHMKFVGPYDLLKKRTIEYQNRLSFVNKKNNWGSEYSLKSFSKNYNYFTKKSTYLLF